MVNCPYSMFCDVLFYQNVTPSRLGFKKSLKYQRFQVIRAVTFLILENGTNSRKNTSLQHFCDKYATICPKRGATLWAINGRIMGRNRVAPL